MSRDITAKLAAAMQQATHAIVPTTPTPPTGDILDELLLAHADVQPQPITTDELLLTPPPQPLLEHNGGCVVMRNGLNVLTGAPKSGKSTAQAWITSLAAQKGLKTLILDTEQGRFGLKTYLLRIASAVGSVSDVTDKVTFVDMSPWRGRGDTALAAIVRAVRDAKPDMVIIDNYRHLFADEDDKSEIQRVNAVLKRLCSDTSVLVTIHTTKTSGYGSMTGHAGSELEREADNVVEVVYDDKTQLRTLRHHRQLCRYWQPVTFGVFCLAETPVTLPDGNTTHIAALSWLSADEAADVTGKASKADVGRQRWVDDYGDKGTFTAADVAAKRGIAQASARSLLRYAADNGLIRKVATGVYTCRLSDEAAEQQQLPITE